MRFFNPIESFATNKAFSRRQTSSVRNCVWNDVRVGASRRKSSSKRKPVPCRMTDQPSPPDSPLIGPVSFATPDLSSLQNSALPGPIDIRSVALAALALLGIIFTLHWAGAVFIPLFLGLPAAIPSILWWTCTNAPEFRGLSAPFCS